jgi:uncharacterized protein (DUF924 family)
VTADDVLAFWFGPSASQDAQELGAKLKRWYMGGEAADHAIAERFTVTVEHALAGDLDAWAETPRGRLALILVLDQMPRSLFRGTSRAFEGDAKALRLALGALRAREEVELGFEERQFLLMPLLHSEELAHVERAGVELRRHVEAAPEWARGLLSSGLEQAEKYTGVLQRFGRYPHRNAALGRDTTPSEVEFLRDWAERAPPQSLTATLSKA